jgi:hypothetical protein
MAVGLGVRADVAWWGLGSGGSVFHRWIRMVSKSIVWSGLGLGRAGSGWIPGFSGPLMLDATLDSGMMLDVGMSGTVDERHEGGERMLTTMRIGGYTVERLLNGLFLVRDLRSGLKGCFEADGRARFGDLRSLPFSVDSAIRGWGRQGK